MGGVEYRVLGKLEVVRDGRPVDLGAFRQRALLALLLTAPNSVLSTDRILNELWGEDGGLDRQNSLWVYVSGLRKALEPGREKRTEGTVLLTRAPGYLLEVDPESIDSYRCERLVAEGRALAGVDPAAASLVLGESLALWRGRAFDEFTYERFAQAEIARLEELRLEAVELRIDADLERGLARELVSELESLVRQYPLNERFAGQLMLALYRSSRQADALRAYQLLRSRLGEELGIDPSPRIRNLEQQIVVGDEGLQRTRDSAGLTATQPGLAVRGYELREQIGEDASGKAYRAYQPAVGREVAIKVIGPELANDADFIRRFTADAQVVATLEHPHIVPLYDYWREPDAAYLVTRLMRGGSLAETLGRGALTPSQAMTVADQLGAALQTAHRAGLAHGDITPDTVLLDDEGNAYLSDLGTRVGDTDADGSADIYGLALVVAQSLTGRDADFDHLRDAVPLAVSDVLGRATDEVGGVRYASVSEFVHDVHDALSGSSRRSVAPASEQAAPVDNPYKGLRAFDAADAVDFFGRERLVERLIARLGRRGTRGRFIAVVGPSGSGKSSAVKAGLLPAIRRGAVPLSGSWFTIAMTPAPHPFEQLEEALLGVAVSAPPSLLDQLIGDDGMQRAIDRVLPSDGSQLLLLIDQFEELFTQVDTATANSFLRNVIGAITHEHSRIRVVVTMRADFYDRPLQHRGLGELMREGTEIITPMTAHELERAITLPAEQRGVTFEPALVAELLREVADRPSALPLLQYTLTELFDGRRGDRLTHDAYVQLGGVSGALVKRAEGLLASLGSDADEVTRQVFLRLVTVTDGGEDTRRRVLQSEIEGLDVDRQLLRSVLDTFGRHRLLSFDRDAVTRSPTVEISHEALLTEWTRLRDWIEGARSDVRAQRRLAESMREWVAAERADAYLLRGGLLEQLHGWAATTSLQLSAPERQFLDASVAERDREASETLQRETRAIVAERGQKRRGRQLLLVGLVALLVAAMGAFGALQWRSAVDSKRGVDDLLMVNRLVTASQSQLDEDPELALLLAMQSLRQTVDLGYATEEAVDALHFALQALSIQYNVDDSTRIAARPGSDGPVGVYVLPPRALMDLAESSTTRSLTSVECQELLLTACPAEVDVPDDLELRGGLDAYAARGMEGTTITVYPGLDLDPGLIREFVEFKQRTGINVAVTAEDAETLVGPDVPDPSDRPDIFIFGTDMPGWARARAVDLGKFVNPGTLQSDFGHYLLSFGMGGGGARTMPADGTIRAIPTGADLKGLVYYPAAEFAKAGYQVPATWDELIALSDQIVADGRTPWCFGFESAPASGWPGTDLIESLALNVGGLEAYDEWTSGEIGFTSPAVMKAAQLADELISTPGYVKGGRATISTETWNSGLASMLNRDSVTGAAEPKCWLYIQADFLLNFVPAGNQVGTDLDFFVLPPVDADQPNTALSTAAFSSALVDRPEVRAFMQFMASPDWGARWAGEASNVFVSANTRFDVGNYGDPTTDPEAAVKLRLALLQKAALESDSLRIDASDLMPPDIGGLKADGSPGAFFQAMINWVDGTRSIEQAFADIDAEWAALKQDSS